MPSFVFLFQQWVDHERLRLPRQVCACARVASVLMSYPSVYTLLAFLRRYLASWLPTGQYAVDFFPLPRMEDANFASYRSPVTVVGLTTAYLGLGTKALVLCD